MGKCARGLLLGLVTAATAGCLTAQPTPAGCRARANAEYQRCLNPQWVPPGEPVEPVRGDRTQACQAAYRQALAQCQEEPEPPVPEIRTSTAAP
jgi:hypothetical protein